MEVTANGWRERVVSYWYAVQTKPRRERLVSAALGRAGLETYCPSIRQRRRRAGKRFFEESPLFPGYLFVKLLFAQDYAAIRWTPGLVRVITTGGSPVQIGEEMLSEIRKLERVGMRHRLHARSLEPGARVRIVEGPFAGFEGSVETHLNGGERIRILLELFRRQAALDCDPEFLRPVAAVGYRS
jgi:transcriptional antiterminator RfaH